MNPIEDIPDYRPVSRRRRLLIALLAIATAVTIVLTMLHPAADAKRHRPPRPEPAPCAKGSEANDCVGGRADVIVPVAPEPSASVPR